MTTANDLIQDALEMLGVYAPGETVDAADASRVFILLNALLDELAAENIFVYQQVQESVALTIAKASYTIGETGADITAARPQQITYGPTGASLSSTGRGLNYAVNDTGTVTTGTGNATYIITAVVAGGAVAAYSLTNAGTTYTSNAATPTATGGAQPGSGTGFLLNITASSGPITASALVGTIIGAPVNVVSSIEFKSLQSYAPAAGQPDTLFYTPTYPLGTLQILPAPAAVNNLTFESWLRIVNFPTPTTSYNLSVGVFDSLRENLAVSAKTYFRDAQIDPLIVQSAVGSRTFLRYQSIVSRAMLNRFIVATNPQKPN